MKKLSTVFFPIVAIVSAMASAFVPASKKNVAPQHGYNLYRAVASIEYCWVPADETNASSFWQVFGEPGIGGLSLVAYNEYFALDPRVVETEPDSGVTVSEEYCEDIVVGDLCLITLKSDFYGYLIVKEFVFGPKQ